ncbi:Hypothetical protein PFR_JS21-2_2215 [Propionibacterium freudenreichii]|uniref:Uncharacterized protein n=3 Tax=Propionibacterium freudenreichii TaxID=1744 RepID=D7GI99_PROFC|nr:hypothetical protein [Propionibacterium freudenreichii]AJQ89825.1 Hypothetical protein RM25_0090 [Propionibacterium freudenreichii subsp. freudenreichii]CBL55821.1 Hypothetical protein PFREUD_02940 [Propionibacterium freudenreichii subsp. shermanii CIRM-BIA1]CUW19813.1 conserved protein [Propionibacterium freudenreichii subsp. shermanii]MDK9655358.1 hypothetical protein [Propionibacterium freudenreichii]CDP49259.1 Hypothetical protein PFCIRM129_10950 [Propionibacterium freudenreichii subsp.
MRRGRKRRGSTDPVPAVLPQIIAEVVSDEHVVLSVGGQRLSGLLR